jgi:ubiquinone/menaquinone biosynthesis C-methylase UbiE
LRAHAAADHWHEQTIRALTAVERVFGLEVPPASSHRASEVVGYYCQSLAGYLLVHCHRGAVHFALDGDDFAAHARIIADHVRAAEARHVLELASGLGYNALRLARLLPSVRVTGVDITPWHVRLARLRAGAVSRVRFERGDLHRLDFAAHELDAVCAVEGFCYADDLRVALGEIARVLRPGGRFVVIDGFLQRPPGSLRDVERTVIRLIDSAMAVSRTWTLDDLVTAGKELGLSAIATEDLTPRVLANVDRTARVAWRYLDRPRRARALTHVLPPKLIRNSIAGVLLPIAVRSGIYGYHSVVLERRRRIAGTSPDA